MKDVKFRCYSNNKMYEVDSLHFWDSSIDLSGAGIISMKNAKLMQDTGLHDKNGKKYMREI